MNRRPAALALVGLAAAVVAVVVARKGPRKPDPQQPPPPSVSRGIWVSKKPLPVPVSECGAVATSRGKIHALGGSAGAMTKNQEYDIATDTWTQRKELPRPRRHPGVAELQGKLYVAGGAEGSAAFDCYDPSSDAWEELPEVPAPASGGDLYAISGKLVRFAHETDTGPTKVQTYDPATRKWETLESRTRFPMIGACTALGQGGLVHFKRDFGVGWYPLPPRPEALINFSPVDVMPLDAAAALLGDRVYCVGGLEPSSAGPSVPTTRTRSTEAKPPFTMFEDHAPLATPRRSLALVASGGKLYALGGIADAFGHVTDALEEFTP
ncbi:MAG TPA: hypothetical protein VFF73_39995 [Planctomycetota bacterium]|nr:hypothetical protein [Planctomycetota bacterium]